ncbi:MAG: hypothetical protein PWQ87_185 [Candidatus Woesearchaeota archaeon]|nr:hypothetical protein [Candidatus Woesearchaeota archaeon]
MGLKRYRSVFFVVFLVLLGLEIFALVKSPFIFVGLEDRVWPFLLAAFILLIASFVPWRIFRNIQKVVNLAFLIFLGFSFVNIFWLDFKVIAFLIATCILGGIKLLLEHFNKKKDLFLKEDVYKYMFLAMLVLISLGSFFDFFSSKMTGLSIITILLGVFVFYYNRDVIDEIEEEKEDEEKAEQKRAKEFDRKFPKLAWFNFDYGITKNWKEKRYFVSILRALAAPFIWFARLPYSFVKWMYKEGWGYSLGLFGVFVLFMIIQIYKIYHTGIGTDEGNFLYTTKLLFEGKTLFLDFWSRESGSLLFLIPWFKIFEISIINLRWFVFLIHVLIFILWYLFLKEISNHKKINITILLISVVSLSFNATLDLFQGIFYQLGNLFSVLILYLAYKNYLKENSSLFIFLIGFLTGLAILCYKGQEIFLVIIPLMIIFKNKEKWKKTFNESLMFFISLLIPILTYWIYYSIKTDFFHIYKIVLNDVFINLGILSLIFLSICLILSKITPKKIFEKERLIILTNILILLTFIYELKTEPEIFFSSFYGGIILSFPVILFSMQFLNLYVLTKYRKILSMVYATINISVLIFGFGSRGFFTFVPSFYHYLACSLVIIHTIFLIYYGIYSKKDRMYKDSKKSGLILVFDFWLIVSTLGGYLMPTRFQTILIFFPLILILIYFTNFKSKRLFSFILFLSVSFSFYININLPTDYTFYTIEEFDEVEKYLKKNFDNESVFSLDTAILASLDNKNVISFHSPFHLREEKDIYFYEGLNKKYKNYDISLTKSEILDKLNEDKPKIIFGAWRSTLRIFEENKWKEFLEENYKIEKKFGRVKVYQII